MAELVLDGKAKKNRNNKLEWVLICGDILSFLSFQLVFLFKILSYNYFAMMQISVLIVGITYLLVYPYIFKKRRDKRASKVQWMGRVLFLGPLIYFGIFEELVAPEFAQVSSVIMMGLLIYCGYKATESKAKIFWIKWTLRSIVIGVPGATFILLVLLNIGN
ncbi:MAG: hypothetical protein ACI959_000691 [Limisphaerales bacterium]|jgi:hypothetical protein